MRQNEDIDNSRAPPCDRAADDRNERGGFVGMGATSIHPTWEGTTLEIIDLAQQLGRSQRLMGIDLGTKTIGLALSDVERRLASPLLTIRRTKFTVAAFVIGLPLNMDGSEGPRAQSTRAFVRQCAALTSLPFVFWDERLSTAAVTRSLIEQDLSRARRAEVVDRMAAAYILQGALDRLNNLRTE
jgi:putative Holliday junction resolvase